MRGTFHSLFSTATLFTKTKTRGRSVLHNTCEHGQLEATKILLRHTNPPKLNLLDAKGFHALHVASRKGYLSTIRTLLDPKMAATQGDEKHQRIDLNPVELDHRRTPLFIAVLCGHLDVVRELLLAGADVNMPNKVQPPSRPPPPCPSRDIQKQKDGKTPLMIAVAKRNEQIVRVLLKNPSSNVNLRTKEGKTALMIAAHKGSSKICGR